MPNRPLRHEEQSRVKKIERRWRPLSDAQAPTKAFSHQNASASRVAKPIDPLGGSKLALRGRVTTMHDDFTVKSDEMVYIDGGAIVAVQSRKTATPTGFEKVRWTNIGGTIYPGLIELHNHPSYNALPLWSPEPQLFQHRGQWPNHPDFRKLISGPMTIVGQYRDAQGKAALLPPLVRYVESKCLLGGVTTSQGIMLNSNAGVQRFYCGILRNVEKTDDPELSEA